MPGIDPSQDQAFLAASPSDQHAYLMATDPGYAKASPDDQQSYLTHLRSGSTNDMQQVNAAALAGGASAAPTQQATSRIASTNMPVGGQPNKSDPTALTAWRATPEYAAQQQRADAGQSMAIPAFLMGLGSMGPVGAIERQGVGQGLKTLGKQALRTVAGTYVGSDLGGKAGNMLDQIIGSKSGIGEEAGRLAGGAYGGYKLSSDPELLARVPFLGRFLTSPEEYAQSLATQRVANQIAMERATASNPDAQQRALGSFMNRGYRSMAPEAPEPSMFSGTATNALPGPSNAMTLPPPSDTPITSTGPQLPFLRSAQSAPPAPDAAPLRPTIGTPEEWNAYDQRMQNLKAEASDAGTYSAARGKVGKKLNYQQRIGKNF